MAKGNRLVWIDLEMTGLDPEQERIIEMATLITDSELNLIAKARCLRCISPTLLWARWTSGVPVLTAKVV